jgi:hypothetical protein
MRLALLASLLLAAGCATMHSHTPPHVAPAPATAQSVYAPYGFLIGEWNVSPAAGGAPAAVTRFRWGPNQSYIWFAVATLEGNREEPHLEGMLMWNGARKDLDMLVALDLNGGRAQEYGRLYVESGGNVVREITSIGPTGATARFRQTFRRESEARVFTSVMRQSGDTWVATFPGSDRLVMTPRTSG